MTTLPLFRRYIGIDYSGAETPYSGLKGLRVYEASLREEPVEVLTPPGPRKHWSRAALAEWLASTLAEGEPALVGIDHGFSFPLRYFEVHHLLPDWPSFLDDFQAHWPTDAKNRYVDFVRNGSAGRGAERMGSSRWRRLTEELCGAKSVFHFDVPGSVAKSTHAGLPWLRYLRQQLGDRLQCWPFDGWDVSPGKSVLVEAYPSLWKGRCPAQLEPGPHIGAATAHPGRLASLTAAGSGSRAGPRLCVRPAGDQDEQLRSTAACSSHAALQCPPGFQSARAGRSCGGL